jgi:hypothetical protein
LRLRLFRRDFPPEFSFTSTTDSLCLFSRLSKRSDFHAPTSERGTIVLTPQRFRPLFARSRARDRTASGSLVQLAEGAAAHAAGVPVPPPPIAARALQLGTDIIGVDQCEDGKHAD